MLGNKYTTADFMMVGVFNGLIYKNPMLPS